VGGARGLGQGRGRHWDGGRRSVEGGTHRDGPRHGDGLRHGDGPRHGDGSHDAKGGRGSQPATPLLTISTPRNLTRAPPPPLLLIRAGQRDAVPVISQRATAKAIAAVAAAALRGAGGHGPWMEQRGGAEAAAGASPGVQPPPPPQRQEAPARRAPWDAALFSGTRRFGGEVLKALEIARTEYDASPPPRIVYAPPALLDPREVATAAAELAQRADYVMAALPAEAAAAPGAHASAVGHPLAAALLQAQPAAAARKRSGGGGGGSSGVGVGGGGAPPAGAAERLQWLQARAAAVAVAAKGTDGEESDEEGGGALSGAFVRGDAAAFWQRLQAEGAAAPRKGAPLVALLPGRFEGHLEANLSFFGAWACCVSPMGRAWAIGWQRRGRELRTGVARSQGLRFSDNRRPRRTSLYVFQRQPLSGIGPCMPLHLLSACPAPSRALAPAPPQTLSSHRCTPATPVACARSSSCRPTGGCRQSRTVGTSRSARWRCSRCRRAPAARLTARGGTR
jgi:hypothetical protein